MRPIHGLFLVLSLLAIGAAWWLGTQGVWGESSDRTPSIRVGSGGNGFANQNVK